MLRLKSKKKTSKKGGSSFMSDLVMTPVSSGFMFMVIFLAFLVLFFTETTVSGSVYGVMLHANPANENLLLNLMDMTYEGHKVSDLLTYAVWNESTIIEVDGEIIDLKEIMSDIVLNRFNAPHKLVLSIHGEETILSLRRGGQFRFGTRTIIQAGREKGYLTLFT